MNDAKGVAIRNPMMMINMCMLIVNLVSYLMVENSFAITLRNFMLTLKLRYVILARRNLGLNVWCGGWDLNPRRPTPTGLEPAPFDLARAPPLR